MSFLSRPSTIRDGIATVFDTLLFTPYPYIASLAASSIPVAEITGDSLLYGLTSVRYVDLRAQLLDQEPLMHHAFDRYTFIRDAYLQHREYVINGGANRGAIYIDETRIEPVFPDKKDKKPAPITPSAAPSGAPGTGYVDE